MQRRSRFFSVEQQQNGRWWFVDPQGKRFLLKGVTTVRFEQDYIKGTDRSPLMETNLKKYGSKEAWRRAAATRLMEWGFNTLGAWSDEELSKIEHEGQRLAYCVNLNLGSKFVSDQKTGHAWLDAIFPDVFDPAFAELARQLAKEFCTPRKDDPMLLGWFSDNELHWGPDWRRQEELLVQFLKLPVGKPGRVAAIGVLQNRYGAFAKFEAVWQTGLASWAEVTAAEAVKAPFVRPGSFGQNEEVERLDTGNDARRTAFVADCDAFLTVLAEQYFSVCDAAIRTADPNHMIFGPRFAYFPEPVVIVAAMKYLDVIAFNCYHADPTMVIQKYEAFGRPLLIGEFVFRSLDSGLPNTKGAGPKVADQSARAAGMELYVKRAMARPAMVGYHWFEHADEPKEGRFDGEDSNVGLVTIKDEPYLELTERFKKVNREVDDLHEQ